jgi:hypothetical protein
MKTLMKLAFFCWALTIQLGAIIFRMNGTFGNHWALSFIPFFVMDAVLFSMVVMAMKRKREFNRPLVSWLFLYLCLLFVLAIATFLIMLSLHLSETRVFDPASLFAPLVIFIGISAIVTMRPFWENWYCTKTKRQQGELDKDIEITMTSIGQTVTYKPVYTQM